MGSEMCIRDSYKLGPIFFFVEYVACLDYSKTYSNRKRKVSDDRVALQVLGDVLCDRCVRPITARCINRLSRKGVVVSPVTGIVSRASTGRSGELCRGTDFLRCCCGSVSSQSTPGFDFTLLFGFVRERLAASLRLAPSSIRFPPISSTPVIRTGNAVE